MKLTFDNVSSLPIKESDKKLLLSLMDDLEEINIKLGREYYFDWQDFHNEYSPERVDPCPDYYGMYRICKDSFCFGEIMTLEDLDFTMCFFYDLVTYE